jgi:hypothetical protein
MSWFIGMTLYMMHDLFLVTDSKLTFFEVKHDDRKS